MTREMNKPEWHNEWALRHEGNKAISDKPSNSRELDDWIKPFFDNCYRMEKLK